MAGGVKVLPRSVLQAELVELEALLYLPSNP